MTKEEAVLRLEVLKDFSHKNELKNIHEAIDMAIEALEQKHGEWIKMDKRGNNVQCSKCGNTLDLRGVNAGRGDANYCPNCGVKMDGK